ncbi:hypothetical protein [Dolichospermum sp. UHCC 0259]|uniref:hypothetical protein n=1 Tax=Dolichospermum sp. UHCC 0259 TaxID=2590010 RepID=UPI001445374E|nr:hypothetical protein [Dolichospermum sp. UHCC 0259]MTJ48645.1 hypothetical protein [Dolichospermum sp. UHCC 0259]
MVVDTVFGNGLLKSESFTILSRLALKIVVMTREQGTGNGEQLQGKGFERFYFSLHITVFAVDLLVSLVNQLWFFSNITLPNHPPAKPNTKLT